MFFPQPIPEVILVKPKRFEDARGYFTETFRQTSYEINGISGPFVQDNRSLSRRPKVIRGLHFQISPSAQSKLVRCTRGAILDVAVDIRKGSPSYGQHVAVRLSEEDGHQLYVPVGFAHGFCTLTADCEVEYKVSAYYDPAAERGIHWNDPDLGIDWPLPETAALVSDRDSALPRLRDMPSYFSY